MTARVIWGSPMPKHHDFAYAEAAEHLAGILRELGHEVDVVTIETNLDATEGAA